MKTKISLFAAIIILIAAVALTFGVTRFTLAQKYQTMFDELNEKYSEKYGRFDKLLAVDSMVRDMYIGELDEKQLLDSTVAGYLAGVGDRYTYYMTSDEFEANMDDLNSELVGIGVHVIYDPEQGAMEVISLIKDSPAIKAGVETGDLIYIVEGQYVSEVGYYGAIALMRGEEGTEVNFSVMRNGESVDLKATRAKITDVTVEYRVQTDPDTGKETDIGFIRVSEFDVDTYAEFQKAVTELTVEKGLNKLIIDMRNNPGGELSSVLKTLDFVLPEGPLINMTDSKGQTETEYSDAMYLPAETVVLVNENTASAAELFSAALQDYNREGKIKSTIVGETTFGKGIMQTITQFEDGSGMSLTFKEFSPPYSESYHGKGVVPDKTVHLSKEALSVNFYKMTEQQDDQLKYAINLLK